MNAYPTADESFARLRRSGWSVGDARLLTSEGPGWSVSGSTGSYGSTPGPCRWGFSPGQRGSGWPSPRDTAWVLPQRLAG